MNKNYIIGLFTLGIINANAIPIILHTNQRKQLY